VLSLLGIFDSTYLAWVYTSPSHPMLCFGGGCDVVRSSQYSHLAGIPIPLYGLAMYLALGLLIFAEPLLSLSLAKLDRFAVAGIAAVGFVFSGYLTSLEAFVIHAWCFWCVISALSVTGILALSIAEWLRPHSLPSREEAMRLMQRQVGIAAFGLILGVPAFWLLAKHEEPPSLQPVRAQALESHLTRPDTHFYGIPNAQVTIVEFGDFECPMCGQEESAAREIREKLGDKVRFAFRQNPLTVIHAQAEKAAEASECAAEQGKFWEAVDKFYAGQSDLSVSSLERYASELGLNMAAFNQCLASGAMVERVERDKADGEALGVRGTPTFFVNGKRIEGLLSFQQVAQLVGAEKAGTASRASSSANASQTAGASPLGGDAPGQSSSLPSNSNPFGSAAGPNALSALQSGAAGCSEAEAKMKQPELIHTEEARRLFEAKALFVDVQPAASFKLGHIPGALNIPADTFAKNWVELGKSRTIVLYEGGLGAGDICAASRAAGRTLLQNDFPYSQVKVYQDGFAAWEKAGLPTEH
jgi:protein-disulfide isomerase/uncharacterized membrane protein/rhodanese-related sulfurtransferase